MTECRCGKPTRDNAYACDDCQTRATRRLRDIPWLEDELQTTITNQRAAVQWGSTSAETPIVFNVPAAEKRDHLRNTLARAIKFCDQENIRHQAPDNEPVRTNDLATMATWLHWRVDGLAFNEKGSELLGNVVDAVAACYRAIDRPPERRYAGPCQECKRDLYHRPGAAEVTCIGCSNRWDVAELYAWMTSQVRDQLVTVSQGATLLSQFDLETTPRIIYGWIERGRLVPHVGEGKGARYLFDDLLTLAAQRGRVA